ncbi:MAG: imidazole glycerol phosphate synthase subunit HisH [Bacteroidota bacterium]|nr:imidazole glycerol phosphate synthase subunit HisH [Bacteroidota bacterium]MDP3146168.1 imidazole glycerol phosphate synthase subunit HisH [Bacteroidota bacterium]MDP3556679.1 imidazole glycerol phosphate synthase subunit HisH [Bacteroidota bacterium]
MITIINYGLGNLGSVQNMLKRIGVPCKITSDIHEIEQAEKILLPGVGAFDSAIQKIDELNLRSVLVHKAKVDKIPFLGICLGMQLLTRSSEEGILKGLDLVSAKTIKFKFEENSNLKIPHMGWNFVNVNTPSKLTEEFTPEHRFYFVHSYKVVCDENTNSILRTDYGGDFDAAIQNDNVYGTQFHPEKSHKYGMQLLSNFSKL